MTDTTDQDHAKNLESFVEENYARLLNYMRKRVPQPDAQELVHDCLEILVKKHAAVEPDRFEPFLFKVASNKLKQYYEKRAKQAGILGFMWSSDSIIPMHVLSTRLSLRFARQNDLEQAMQKLTVRQHDVFELRLLEGLTISDAAEALGISEATVKRDIDNARELLITELGEDTLAKLVDAYTK